jgi:SAM-dependent methyltransferase
MSLEALDHNQAVWDTPLAAYAYRNADALFAPERAIIHALAAELCTGHVLDIGIGTGRTTRHLYPLCGRYVGIDYSAEMILRATERCPDADLRLMDARSLAEFADASFDVVMFSFNGIDYVDHQDRLRILREVRRVLKPSGAFAFSSHRRGTPVRRPYDPANLALSFDPIKLAAGVARYALGIRNAIHMASEQYETADYALVNDAANQYSLLTYYISREAQQRQLRYCGFQEVAAYGVSGRRLDDGCGMETGGPDDYMIHYLARAV